jgi:hypothetical protein
MAPHSPLYYMSSVPALCVPLTVKVATSVLVNSVRAREMFFRKVNVLHLKYLLDLSTFFVSVQFHPQSLSLNGSLGYFFL